MDIDLGGSTTLGNLGDHLIWYSHVNPERTVSIVNEMKTRVQNGEQIFYDIYTEEEKESDPSKADTGLFFFRGDPGEKFAVTNAGGGFMYVAAMHDSFPHMQELAEQGYNAFALVYRPGAQTACEDLARAIAFIHEHAEELQVDTEGYSLWGGSAGARMAAWLGSYGTAGFGEAAYPAPGAVIMQYTGLSDVYGNEPPTYACVGTRDGIASYRTMERRIEAIKDNGTAGEIEVFDGLPHGFGLGGRNCGRRLDRPRDCILGRKYRKIKVSMRYETKKERNCDMSILFINGSPDKNGNTAALASAMLKGKEYETLNLTDYRIGSYGQQFADDQLDLVIGKMKAAYVIVMGSPLYWHNICGSVRNVLDRFYGLVENGELSGRTLYFLFQGASPEKWMMEAGEYTMKRFAMLYGMQYGGMATNRAEAERLGKQI